MAFVVSDFFFFLFCPSETPTQTIAVKTIAISSPAEHQRATTSPANFCLIRISSALFS